jgi:hypothetical protein
MSGLAIVVGIVVSALAAMGYMVGRSMLRQTMRKNAIDRVEERAQSSVRKAPARPAVERIAAPVRPGSGFGRVHLGVIARSDPDFDELALRAWFADTVVEALSTKTSKRMTEGALAALRGGPRGRMTAAVQLGRVQIHGVFADELWSNVELGFGALVEDEDDAISWREDRWRIRKKRGGDWQVVTISDTRRLLQLPDPPQLPLGPTEGALLPAIDLDWGPVLRDHPDIIDQAECLLRAVLTQPDALMAPGLSRALDLDRQRCERHLDVEEVAVVEPLRASSDAAHRVLELRLLVRAKAWFEREPESASTHYAALTMAMPKDGGDWFALDLCWVEPPAVD